MNEFIDSLWHLKLPNKWQGEHGEECATIYHADGVGALQISTFKKDGTVDQADLEMLAGELLETEREITTLRVGDFNGFSFALEDDEGFWRYWFVAGGACALAATYNCDLDDREKEAGVVQEILRSLRLNIEENR